MQHALSVFPVFRVQRVSPRQTYLHVIWPLAEGPEVNSKAMGCQAMPFTSWACFETC